MRLTLIQDIAVWVLPLVFAITVHEASHAWAANRLGDPTAKILGRLSFNPIRHIDLIGTIIIPLAVAVLSNFHFVFGWAKPVPIDTRYFKKIRRDTALTAAAGPLSNVLMLIGWALLLKMGIVFNFQYTMAGIFLILMAKAGILANAVLFALNILPLPPLDGSKVLNSFLPVKYMKFMEYLEQYGLFLLIILLFTGVLGSILMPLINGLIHIITAVFNL